MSRQHVYAVGLAAFALLGGFAVFQACMGPPESGGEELGTIDEGTGGPPMPPPMSLDAGSAEMPELGAPPAPIDPQQPTAELPTTLCSEVQCAAGEVCCPSNGACVPAGCADCCPFHEAEAAMPTIPVPSVVPGAESPVPPPPAPFEPPGPGPRPGVGAPGGSGPLPPPSPEQ